jgi:hypothetical protein
MRGKRQEVRMVVRRHAVIMAVLRCALLVGLLRCERRVVIRRIALLVDTVVLIMRLYLLMAIVPLLM